MKIQYWLFLVCFITIIGSIRAQQKAHLSVSKGPDCSIAIVMSSPGVHEKYGFTYPMTYQIKIPGASAQFVAERKYSVDDAWNSIQTKTSSDFFNGIEAVRFDYANNTAYVSVTFSPSSDTLYLRIVDHSGNPVTIGYCGISKYYDNRRAVVTVTADDWSDWVVADLRFPILMNLFRSYGLYVTIGIQTGSDYTHPQTWDALQQQVDAGYVEVAAHSRTHPHTPYSDPVGEVVGSCYDIVTMLTLPPPLSMNGKEYVYTWLAPYGDFDSTVDSLLGVAGYLDARLYANLPTTDPREYIYGDSTLSAWDETRNHFQAFFPTVEFGAPSWGGGNTSLTSLNNLFDTVVTKGDVYHLMWHPQVIFTDRNTPYLTNHLSHISGRKDIWYTNLGLLYLYHYLQVPNNSPVDAVIASAQKVPGSFKLYQNYPNPFNPTTTISFSVPSQSFVSLRVFDLLGRELTTLVSKELSAGNHTRQWNAESFPSGVYFCRIEAGSFTETKNLILLR